MKDNIIYEEQINYKDRIVHEIDSDQEYGVSYQKGKQRSVYKRFIEEDEMNQNNNFNPNLNDVNNADSNQQQLSLNYNFDANQNLQAQNYHFLSKKNILGIISYKYWNRIKRYYFSLDVAKGRILCFKQKMQKSPSTRIKIIKGKFEETAYEDDNDNGQQTELHGKNEQVIYIANKKGKKFKLELFQEKDSQNIREYINTCFRVERSNAQEGIFITLGNGVVSAYNTQFKVVTGIFILDKKVMKKNGFNPKNGFYGDKKTKFKDSNIPVSGMFFGGSSLLDQMVELVLNIQAKERLEKDDIKSQAVAQQALYPIIGLLFKPEMNTIDLIMLKLKLNGEEFFDKVIISNFFKIESKKKKKKNAAKYYSDNINQLYSQKQISKHNQDDQIIEAFNNEYILISKQEDEMLYIKKNNNLISPKEIWQASCCKQNLILEEVDNTNKVDEGQVYEEQVEIINTILNSYILKQKQLEKFLPKEVLQNEQMNIIQQNGKKQKQICQEFWEFLVIIPEQSLKLHFQNQTNLPQQQEEENLNQIEADENIDSEQNRMLHNINIQGKLQSNAQLLQKGKPPIFHINQSPFKSSSIGTLNDSQKQNQQQQQSQQIILKIQDDVLSDHILNNQIDSESAKQYFNSGNQLSDYSLYQLEKHNFQGGNLSQNYSQDENIDDLLVNQKKTNFQSSVYQQENIAEVNEPPSSSLKRKEQLRTFKEDNGGNSIERQKEQAIESDSEEENNFREKAISLSRTKNVGIYFNGTVQQLNQLIQTFLPVQMTGEVRTKDAYKSGGQACLDVEVTKSIRSVGKYMIKEIGRKIITGDFNLTTISFPISAMVPRSALQNSQMSTIFFPLYMNRAAQCTDKVERFKLLIAAIFGSFPLSNTFFKPLNPVLGETLEGEYLDGTKFYGEQVAHHPPISYFLLFGPNNSYRYSGYYNFKATAGLNSATVRNRGTRSIQFKDGQVIKFNFGYEVYKGTFLGQLRTESLGTLDCIDEQNHIVSNIIVGKEKKKPTDYLSGDIKINGKVVSKVYGTYLGYIEFDGVRYWDQRTILPFQQINRQSVLESDHQKRLDRVYLEKGDIKAAQKYKEAIEKQQRADERLRILYHKKQSKNKND